MYPDKNDTNYKVIGVIMFSVLLLLAAIINLIFVFAANAWTTQATATLTCNENGHVYLNATFTNNEPTQEDTGITVTADHGLGTTSVAPQSTGNFTPSDSGNAPIASGVVTFTTIWADGHGSIEEGNLSDTFTVNYEGIETCEPPVNTPSVQPPSGGGGSSNPPPTTSPGVTVTPPSRGGGGGSFQVGPVGPPIEPVIVEVPNPVVLPPEPVYVTPFKDFDDIMEQEPQVIPEAGGGGK